MHVPFEQLPPSSRIWIYQSERPLTSSDLEILSPALRAFTEGWLVHGQPIDASFEIRYNRFVILAANDPASGCSIDHSVRTMKELGQTIKTDFLNRNNAAFFMDGQVTVVETASLRKAFAEGTWEKSTVVFNNLVDTKGSLAIHWMVPASDTWLKRYFTQETVSG
jgi:hypothetical protein